MKIERILKTAESISHIQRWKYMIGLGRDSVNDKSLSNSLLKLTSSEIHYERLLALMSAHGSYNKEIIVNLLTDPSIAGMFSAVKLAATHLDDELLTDITPKLPNKKRMGIVKVLVKKRRFSVIERIYDKSSVLVQKDLLLYTSEPFFKEHADGEVMESLSQEHWRLMAKRFPALAYEELKKILNENSEPSWLAQTAVQAVLQQFYKTAPAMGISLLKCAILSIHPHMLPLERYAVLFPESVAELTLGHSAQIHFIFPVSALRELQNEKLCAMAKNYLAFKILAFQFTQIFPKITS